MDNMEYIDDYFKSSPTDAQRQQFEQRVINDISFAEEVAFYISANGALKDQLKEEKKQVFREIYQLQKVVPITRQPVKKTWRYMAAASVVAAVLLLTWLMTGNKNSSSQQLAEQYIQQNFNTLPVTMGSQDSMQRGISLLNTGKLTEALGYFENIIKGDSSNDGAKKFAGITSLRLTQYDKALAYFTMLERETALYSNPGKFYRAVTLLKRNTSGDEEAAKKLLQEVIAKDLEGKTEAQQLLKKTGH